MYPISTLRLTGPDASAFLQGQLTNDIVRLESEPEIRAAWCNPKGRVIWSGVVRRIDGGYEMDVPADTADDVLKRLAMFRFRSKVEFEIVDGGRSLDPAVLIDAGVPWIGREQTEQFTPHMLNLDLLDAISFDKGCYTGQEIVARTHYKGATKRRTLRFACSASVRPGDKVQLEGRDVGEVLNVSGGELLAVVPVDKANQALCAGSAPLEPRPIPYL